MAEKKSSKIAFDVYGTLVDPLGMRASLERFVGDAGAEVARVWREKQLEYTWRRALMGLYAPFSVCTAQALEYAFGQAGVTLSGEASAELFAAYRALPAFADAAAGLERLIGDGYRMVAFSNGEPEAVNAVLEAAGLRKYLEDVISVDEVQSYKPDPAVYRHLGARLGLPLERVWLVSSNPFDVIGARAAGMHAAWVRRQRGTHFDPWGIEPDVIVESIGGLAVELNKDAN